MLNRLGPRGGQTCAALSGCLSNTCRGLSGILGGAIFSVGSVLGMGCAAQGAISSIRTSHALSAGMGAGQYQGMYANLRALVYVFGPLLYTRFYAYQTSKGRNPGASYFLVAVL